MGTFKRSSSVVQDTARDVVCSHLQSLGISASKAAQGRPEEGMGADEYSPAGVIDISHGPISWANVLTTGKGRAVGRVVYGIQASNLLRIGDIQMWSVRVKRFPVIGKTVDFRWESYIKLPYALHPLSEDPPLKDLMVQYLREDVEIRSQPRHRYWLLHVGRGGPLHLPSLGEWECYQAIASALVRVS